MSLANIEHIVVLVMENRSFDHMLGYLSLEGGRTDVEGLRPEMLNPYTLQGRNVGPTLLGVPRFYPGPNHEHEHVMRQMQVENAVPTMNGFVDDYATVRHVRDASLAMGYHNAETAWFYDFLATEYLLCDRWFSSFPGPTHVNRAFLLAGHSANKLSNFELIKYATSNRLKTLFDTLEHGGVDWRSYFHDVPVLRTYAQFKFHLGNIHKIDRFYEDATAGRLPKVSWIDPNFDLQGTIGLPDGANDDHPPADVSRGQALVSRIYEALTSRPESWAKTLFVITYDEHGGFFDHVPPPRHADRAPFRKHEQFDYFGVRVPTMLVSPWVQRSGVCHAELEHTSIAKTILERFCPSEDLTTFGERLRAAPSLGTVLQATPRTDIPQATGQVAARRAAALARPQAKPQALGKDGTNTFELEPVDLTDLQVHLRALQAELRGQGMPPGTI